jgi:antitoxin component YwqK of YwqJK toxin-antitoxin module
MDMKPIIVIISCFIMLQCDRGPKVEEVKSEAGTVIERFTVYSGTMADKKNMRYEKFDEDGIAMESIEYKEGKMNGVRKIFDKGVLYSTETRKNDLFDGPYISFYQNGQKQMEGTYTQDVLAGDVKVYYPSGALKEIVRFENNVETGPFKEFYENGKIKAEGNYIYKDGAVEHGLLSLFDSTGTLIKKMDCKEGICQTIWKL